MYNFPMRFEIPIKPKAKARPRCGRNGAIYTPMATVEFENEVKFWVMQQSPKKLLGPLKADLMFFYSRPKVSSKSRVLKDSKPDLDNLVKAVLDALNGICYDDDSQIVDLRAAKRYDEDDSIILDITQMDG